MQDDATDWCIARTQAGQTLGLARGLAEAGYRSWTPSEVIVRRARRSIPRKEVTVPLMPGIVFVDYARLAELLALARSNMNYQTWDSEQQRMVARGLPYFRILRVDDRYPRIRDAELSGVRMAEAKGMVRVKRQMLKVGAKVRLREGAFEGLTGAVQSVKGAFAHVRFAGWPIEVTIALHLLIEVKS